MSQSKANDKNIRYKGMTSEQTIDINSEPSITKSPVEEQEYPEQEYPVSTKGTMKAMVVATFGEFVGMTVFIFLALTSAQAASKSSDPASKILMIATGFGLSLMISMMMVARVSGGHLNPSVTIALAAAGKFPRVQAIAYIVAQCIGSCLGSILTRLVVQTPLTSFNAVSQNNSVLSALLAEILMTFAFVLTAVTTVIDGRIDPGFIPTLIGFALFAVHLAGAAIDGTSVNPARSFGASLVAFHWDNHWIFWVGPIVGSLLASGTHRIFKLAAQY
ncbi:hypothetical protein HDV01_004476 [Terramyces sp. JEL0728]|nr:hypothetical protein HDV01_004476 [Terramyces sp. JEL0728]